MNIGGHKINNWWLVGGAAGVGVVLFVYKRNSSSSGSAAGSGSVAAGTGTDPLTGLPYSEDSTIDPVTGMTYLQEAQQYGSVEAAEAAVSGQGTSPYAYDPYGYGSGYGTGGYVGTTGYPTGNPGSGTGTYSSNAAWAQAVTAGLTGLGYSATDVSAALGLYFQSMPLGTAADGVSYLSIVQAAVAEYGPPPVGSFQIIPRTPTGNPSSQVTIPDVTGIDAQQATVILRDVGLKVSGPAGVTGAVHVVTSTSPAAGTKVDTGSTVTLHTKTEDTSATQVTVPNVVGTDVQQATTILTAAGLKASGPAGATGVVHAVTRQSPAAGSKVNRGTTVTLTTKTVNISQWTGPTKPPIL